MDQHFPELFPSIHQHKTASSTYLSSIQDQLMEQQGIYFSVNTQGKHPYKSKDSQSLKYSQISCTSIQNYNQQQLIKEIDKTVQNISQNLDLPEIQDIIIQNKQLHDLKYYNRINLYQRIQSLQQNLQILQKQILTKDNSIKQLQTQNKNLTKSYQQLQDQSNDIQQKLLQSECKVLELQNIIIHYNISESKVSYKYLSTQPQSENMQMQHQIKNKQLQEQIKYLIREKNVLKSQLEQQHKLILNYQKDSLLQFKSTGENQINQFRRLLNQIKKYAEEVLQNIKRQLELTKIQNMVKIGQIIRKYQQHINLIKQQHNKQKQHTNIVQQKRTICQQIQPKKLNTEQNYSQLFDLSVCPMIKQSQTDIKPLKYQRHNRNSLANLMNNDPLFIQNQKVGEYFNRINQPTKLLKRQIMNAGKCINITVNQNQVTKEVIQKGLSNVKKTNAERISEIKRKSR